MRNAKYADSIDPVDCVHLLNIDLNNPKREIEHGLCACKGDYRPYRSQAMLYHTCTMVSCGDLAHYRVSRARD